MIVPHVRNKWDKLKTVMLGTPHMPEFFDGIKNPKIREPLKQITHETIEDLDNFEKILKDFGCKVIRTETEHKRIEEYSGFIPRNAMQPRDGQLVIDNKLVFTTDDNKGIGTAIKEHIDQSSVMFAPAYADIYRQRITSHTNWEANDTHLRLYAPNITAINDKIIIDTLGLGKNADPDVKWFRKKFPNKQIEVVEIGGHSDACFATLKEGVILSLFDIMTYEDTLPGWDVCYLQDQGSHHQYRLQWEDWKEKVNHRWYVEGQGHNDEFIKYVNTWLDEWVGNVWETVFDVNVLTLDPNHVCIAQQENETVNKFFKKHNIEPVYVQWRHRWFWDAGLHCITLDLEREY